MTITLACPAVLPLALVRDPAGAPALLGITLQHPPVSLLARAAPTLTITGARADLANRQGQRFLERCAAPQQGEVEIDLAIPRAMGLESDVLLGLSVARALASLHRLPTDTAALAAALDLGPGDALAAWGFAGGGMLLVSTLPDSKGQLPQPLRRQAIAHPDQQAWAFVLVLPRTTAALPLSFEADRKAALLAAAAQLSAESWQLLDEALWPAVERDDLEAFGTTLETLQQLNRQALAATGTKIAADASPAEAEALTIMRQHGAVACGRCLTGLGLYALVRGASATISLRNQLREQAGFFGATIMAAITDNRGAIVR